MQNDDNKTLQLNIALIQVSENKNTIVFQNNDFLSYADEDGFYQSESVELIDDLPLYLVVFSSEDFEKEFSMIAEYDDSHDDYEYVCSYSRIDVPQFLLKHHSKNLKK